MAYPLPLDNWQEFKPYAQRFTSTFKKFWPGIHDYELFVVANWGEPTDEIREMFYGIKARFVSYYGNGCDIGSWHQVFRFEPCEFFVGFTSRCYLHKAGWLERLRGERTIHGEGLYVTSASHEGGRLHGCIRAIGIDPNIFINYVNTYPWCVQSRDRGTEFEVGSEKQLSLSEFTHKHGYSMKLVTWDGCWDKKDWFNRPNRFRDGDQSNMLVWDKHTDAYRDADAAEKERLKTICETPP